MRRIVLMRNWIGGNYIEGIKLLGAYLHYVAEEPMKAQ